jgi:hypothetical protein
VADLVVNRPEGYELVASYPTVATRSSAWDLDIDVTVNSSELLFTEQPVIVLEGRESAGRREIVLLAYSATAGAIGAALTIAVRSGFDARAARRASTHQTG